METYSLLMLFAALIVIWWFSWAPWRKRSDEAETSDDDTPNERSGR